MSKVNALKAPRTENIMSLLGQWTRAELEELIVAKVNAAAVITRDDLIKVRKSTRQTRGVPKLTKLYTDSSSHIQSIGNLCPDLTDLRSTCFDAKGFF